MPSEITAEELSKLPTPDPIESLSLEDKAAWDVYLKGELPKLKQKLAELSNPTAPPAESVEDSKALEHRETLAGMLSMATDMKAAWIPWERQIGALRFALDAVDDFKTIEKACFYCAQTEYYGDPERHHHEPEGWHWHHYLDPGDGLPSPCANSDLLERCLEAEIERFVEEVEAESRRLYRSDKMDGETHGEYTQMAMQTVKARRSGEGK